jgi:hypothetical protein
MFEIGPSLAGIVAAIKPPATLLSAAIGFFAEVKVNKFQFEIPIPENL